jgi:hypothetical protein
MDDPLRTWMIAHMNCDKGTIMLLKKDPHLLSERENSPPPL